MSDDIGKILENWDYRLGRVDARRVTIDDGSEKLQMRIDLGLLQMNAQFRPDGKRPFGHPTLLDHFLLRLEKHRNKHGGEDDEFSINPDECAKLQQEAIQFHHRSICNFELNDLEAVERDTDHILELPRLCAGLRRAGGDRQQLSAVPAPDDHDADPRRGHPVHHRRKLRRSHREIRAAIDELNDFYSGDGPREMVDNSMEVHSLREWLKDVETEAEEKRPVTEREKLERKLSKAIKAENYEQAAELRDRISSLSPDTE